jgi:hypothetical protein
VARNEDGLDVQLVGRAQGLVRRVGMVLAYLQIATGLADAVENITLLKLLVSGFAPRRHVGRTTGDRIEIRDSSGSLLLDPDCVAVQLVAKSPLLSDRPRADGQLRR